MKDTRERCSNPDIFLSGLPIEMRRGDLRGIINRLGIESAFVEIVAEKHGEVLPAAIAFVRLREGSDVLDAITKLDGMRVDPVHVVSASRYVSHIKRERPAPRVSVTTEKAREWQRFNSPEAVMQ